MPGAHPYHLIEIPGDAPLELKPSPGKGWGAFATRRIERGVSILSEEPLFIIPKPHEKITDGDVTAAFRRLSPAQQRQFSLLRDNSSHYFLRMEAAFAENSFALGHDNGSRSYGLFVLHSRFNHSCLPNSKIPTTDGMVISSFATRNILPGEEITFSYNSDFEGRTSYERHQALRFVCNCRACRPGTTSQQCSNMRRRLIRGLQYLTHGVDLDGKTQGSGRPIIADLALRNAAEQFRIPLSSRLIYDLLTIVLIEHEGLLDDFMLARVKPGVHTIATMFLTRSNADIAALAMAQETWIMKLDVACRLYGLQDTADDAVSVAIAR